MAAQLSHRRDVLNIIRICVGTQGEPLWYPPEQHLAVCQIGVLGRSIPPPGTYLAIVRTGRDQVVVEGVPVMVTLVQAVAAGRKLVSPVRVQNNRGMTPE